MKWYTFSGGGLRFGQHSAASIVLNREQGRADGYLGVSAGAIAVLISAMEINHRVYDLATSPNILQYTFGGRSSNPFTKKGKLSPWAVARVLKGYLSGKPPKALGNHYALGRTYSRIITREMFEDFKNNPESPKVGVMYVELTSAKRVVKWVHECQYEEWINAVLASSCIPPIMQPIIMDGVPCADGGLRSHSPADWLLKYKADEVSSLYEVYARPQDISNFYQDHEDELFSNVSRSIDILILNTSKDDEATAKHLSEKAGIYHKQIFLPKVLKGTFDNDEERLKRAYLLTKQRVAEQLRTN